MSEQDATFTIKTLASALNLSEVYVRRAIHKGKLQTTLVPIKEGSEIVRHVITQEAADHWRTNLVSRTTREDGRNKFTMYATPEEYASLIKQLEEQESEIIVQRANKPKKAPVATS